MSLPIVALVLFAGMAGPAAGAPPHTMGSHMGSRMRPGMSRAQMQAAMNRGLEYEVDELTKDLHLNASQKGKAREIFEDTGRKMVPLLQNRSTNPKERMEKMQALRKEGQDRFMKILTSAQKKKYISIRAAQMKAMRARMRQRGMGPGGRMGPGANRMANPKH